MDVLRKSLNFTIQALILYLKIHGNSTETCMLVMCTLNAYRVLKVFSVLHALDLNILY
jgi:hypothetical protein